MPIFNPCFRCTCRSIGCHASCSEYLSYRQRLDCIRAQQREEKRTRSLMFDGFERLKRDPPADPRKRQEGVYNVNRHDMRIALFYTLSTAIDAVFVIMAIMCDESLATMVFLFIAVLLMVCIIATIFDDTFDDDDQEY